MKDNVHIIHITLGISRSKQYAKAINLCKQFPNYTVNEKTIECFVDDVLEYIKIQNTVDTLLRLIKKWKSASILLFGCEYRREIDYSVFLHTLKRYAGKYAPLIRAYASIDISVGNSITYEDLPLPIVHYPGNYGVFFAFSTDVDSQPYFCECDRKSIERIYKLRMETPLCNCSGSRTHPLSSDFFPESIAEHSRIAGNPISELQFKRGICFRCNNKIPSLKYCHPMYGGLFKQKYGWYIKREMIDSGIDPQHLFTLEYGDESLPSGVKKTIVRVIAEFNGKKADYYADHSPSDLRKEYEKAIENIVRERFGFPRIGEKWISETLLFHIVRSLFPDAEVSHHFRPTWLEGLELDVYVPSEKLAFEYQGIQHYRPVDHWGGMKQFIKQQEHDQRKKAICDQMNIRLICIKYDEELTAEYIKKRVETDR